MAELLATGPFVDPGNGFQPRRLTLAVIRNDDGSPREFVVQSQCVDECGQLTLQRGDWIPVINSVADAAQEAAYERFMERMTQELHYPLADLTRLRFASHLASLTIETGKG